MPNLSRKSLLATLLVLILLWSPTAPAAVMLLVHGYMSDGQSFHRAGVVDGLREAGWHDGGEWQFSMDGRVRMTRDNGTGSRTLYTVTLPANAPLALQADWLTAIRHAAESRHPDQSITLVGHSAGGVVGRLALVRGGPGAVSQLITIASPHLGTERAIQALQATNGGGIFGPFRQMLTRQAVGGNQYDTLRHSQALLADLVPPQPGNLLGWLNVQKHPDIQYVAVVRNTGFRMGGDVLVPAWSQDMNQVPALRGRATTIPSPLDHALNATDARLILERIRH